MVIKNVRNELNKRINLKSTYMVDVYANGMPTGAYWNKIDVMNAWCESNIYYADWNSITGIKVSEIGTDERFMQFTFRYEGDKVRFILTWL